MNQEARNWGIISFIIAALVVGIGVGYAIGIRRSPSESQQNHVNPVYHPADNAIARFGLAPVNPDWVQVTHKSSQPIDGVPSHEWAVFTFAFEPKVEKIEQSNGAVVWKVTFEP